MSFFVLAMIALAAFVVIIVIGFVLLVFEDYVFAIAMSFFCGGHFGAYQQSTP